MSTLRTVARGTMANLVRGIAPVMLSGLLPVALVLLLPADRFSAWALAVSLAAYVPVFSLGVESAVTAAAGGVRGRTDSGVVLAAALQFLAPLMILAGAGLIVVALFTLNLFPGIPRAIVGQFGVALAVLGAASIATTLATVAWGYAIGIDRIRIAFVASVTGQFVSAIAAIAAARASANLVVVALAYSAPLLVSLPVQLLAVQMGTKAFGPTMRRQRRRLRRAYRRAAPVLGTWSVATLMVTGLDGAIVGRLDYHHTGVYVLTASVVRLLVAAAGAWQPSFLAHAPRTEQRWDEGLIVTVARLSTLLNLVLLAVVAIPAWVLLDTLFNRGDARLGFVVFVILLFANSLRVWLAPGMLTAVAAKRYERIALPAVVEGLVNVTGSILLGRWLGAAGVALGTAIGAMVVIPVVRTYTAAVAQWRQLMQARLLRFGLVGPLAILAVPVVVACAVPLLVSQAPLRLVLQVPAAMAAIVIAWRWGMRTDHTTWASAAARSLALAGGQRPQPPNGARAAIAPGE